MTHTIMVDIDWEQSDKITLANLIGAYESEKTISSTPGLLSALETVIEHYATVEEFAAFVQHHR
jgi:hypothetical protein